MSLECVLFDFDGTLADTEMYNIEYFSLAMECFGVTVTEEDKDALIGNTDPGIIQRILSRSPLKVSMDEWRKVRQSVGNTYEHDERLKPAPGVPEMLSALKGKGLKLAVVSSTATHLVTAALKRLSLYDFFDLVLCGDEFPKRKPDPAPYLLAMERLGVKAEDCIVVEDSPSGIQSGKAAGAYVIAYKGGSYEQDTSKADFEIKDFSELLSKCQIR